MVILASISVLSTSHRDPRCAELPGSWSDWEFQAMQRVGPKESRATEGNVKNDQVVDMIHVGTLWGECVYIYFFFPAAFWDLRQGSQIVFETLLHAGSTRHSPGRLLRSIQTPSALYIRPEIADRYPSPGPLESQQW